MKVYPAVKNTAKGLMNVCSELLYFRNIKRFLVVEFCWDLRLTLQNHTTGSKRFRNGCDTSRSLEKLSGIYSHVQRQNTKGFCIVSWLDIITYPKRIRSWSKPSHASTSSKSRISMVHKFYSAFGEISRVVYYELLKPNGTITGSRYRQQLI